MIICKPEATQRQLNALATKKKIFQAAITLFATHGYDKVTIDDITRRSGTAKGSFYTHFKSKEHIMLEQFKQIDSNYEQWFVGFKAGHEAIPQLFSFINCITEYASTHLGLDILKVVFSSQISLSSPLPQLLADESRPYFKIMCAIVRCGQEQQEISTSLSDTTIARLMTRWIRSLVYDWCLANGNFDLVQEARSHFPGITAAFRETKRYQTENPYYQQ